MVEGIHAAACLRSPSSFASKCEGQTWSTPFRAVGARTGPSQDNARRASASKKVRRLLDTSRIASQRKVGECRVRNASGKPARPIAATDLPDAHCLGLPECQVSSGDTQHSQGDILFIPQATNPYTGSAAVLSSRNSTFFVE